ncbi:MAG: 2OG-Fe(II) oxygenase [Xanthomonadales bacterium]|nr:2OG-Fe(II) oxygenase [Xanthomonadales bacterium]
MLAAELDHRIPGLSQSFASARPFRHVVIDGFLDDAFAHRLLAEFPPFDAQRALNEMGEVGGKAVVERIRALGAGYARLDDLVSSPAFLDTVSRVTGIPDLRYDEHYFGGGTHENRQGQDLDPHVDFNYHPLTRWHRRLNLIIYLNPEWDDAWGGSLELHSDPRSDDDRVELVTPLFNRAVIFETNEISWHGFSRIELPAERAGITRRSIALYFYTEDRPEEETAATHSTIYVERPLPKRFRPGITLTDHDFETLRVLLKRRDTHIERLYRDLKQLQAQMEHQSASWDRLRRNPIFRGLNWIRRRLRGQTEA